MNCILFNYLDCTLIVFSSLLIFIIGIFLMIFLLPPLSSVCTNCVGIPYNTVTKEYLKGDVKKEGLYFAGYYVKYKTIPTTHQLMNLDLYVLSNDGLTMPLNVAIIYKYKTTWDDIYNILVNYNGNIDRTLKYIAGMSIRNVFSTYEALSIYEHRSDISIYLNIIDDKLEKAIKQDFSDFSVEVQSVHLTGSDVPDKISLAIQDSVNAEQDILLAKSEQDVIEIQAETLIHQWELLANITSLFVYIFIY